MITNSDKTINYDTSTMYMVFVVQFKPWQTFRTLTTFEYRAMSLCKQYTQKATWTPGRVMVVGVKLEFATRLDWSEFSPYRHVMQNTNITLIKLRTIHILYHFFTHTFNCLHKYSHCKNSNQGPIPDEFDVFVWEINDCK